MRVLVRPKESSDGELPLLINISGEGEAVVGEEAVELPLRHLLIVALRIPWVVKRHLELMRRRRLLQPFLHLMMPVCYQTAARGAAHAGVRQCCSGTHASLSLSLRR